MINTNLFLSRSKVLGDFILNSLLSLFVGKAHVLSVSLSSNNSDIGVFGVLIMLGSLLGRFNSSGVGSDGSVDFLVEFFSSFNSSSL